ncbi:MAG: hypothetical protein IPP17_10665 [Bacteroidetes bacterium]|nr:hypothetical protein [Bacteroidota bacterium]
MMPLIAALGVLHRVGVPGQTGVTSKLEALTQGPMRGGMGQPLSATMESVPIGETLVMGELQSR